MLSASGISLPDTYDYNAFGDIYNRTGTTPNRFAYTGQQYDDETGLYFLRARYYDPSIGRFLSQDPYPVNTGNPMELNRYVYTANNPVNYDDPSGLTILDQGLLTNESSKVAQYLAPVGLFVAAVILVVICYLMGPCNTAINAIAGGVKEVGEKVGDAFISDFVNGPMDWGGDWPPGRGKGPNFDPIGAFFKFVKVIATFIWRNAVIISTAVWVAGQVIRYVAPRVIPWLLPHTRNKPKPEKEEECDPKKDPKCDPPIILYHYTFADTVPLILNSGVIWPSIKKPNDPKSDAVYGDGQYMTDIDPLEANTRSKSDLSNALYDFPDRWGDSRVGWLALRFRKSEINRVAATYQNLFPGTGIYLRPGQSNLVLEGKLVATGRLAFAG